MMLSTILILPIILPLMAGVFLTLWRTPSKARDITMLTLCFIQSIISISIVWLTLTQRVLILPMGGWPATIGIVLTVDHFTALLISITSIITLIVCLYSAGESNKAHPLRLPLIQFMVAGVTLSFATGDFFNLFVAFEIMLMASYALLVLECKASDLPKTYSYLTLNIVGSALFLAAGGFVYALFGTLNFANISAQMGAMSHDYRIVIITVFLIFVYGLKAGIFPLFYWLPNSYHTLPPALGGLFAGLLTKVGLYALLRILAIFLGNFTFPLSLLIVLSIPTMIIGILLALRSDSLRTILSFNLISHIGFMILGIGIFTHTSISGTIYYMGHHMIVIASLFLIGGIMMNETNTDTISEMGNLWKKKPVLACLFGLQALSLIGIPPFSGFWGKLMIMTSGLEAGHFFAITMLVLASILTLLSMIIVWFHAFYKSNARCLITNTTTAPQYISVFLLVGLSLGLGLGSQYATHSVFRASDHLLDNATYRWQVKHAPAIKNLTDSPPLQGGHP